MPTDSAWLIRDGGFGIYVHWPFCLAKCPYCDFNSHVAGAVDQKRWLRAFESEIQRYQSIIGDRLVGSVYFGGGTPSLMEGATVAGVLDAIRAAWPVANDWEVTLEANPTSVEAGRFADYSQAGVNRVSLGVQALRNEDLRRLGRQHSVQDAMAAFDLAASVFERVSFDLIYARQDQSLKDWLQELDWALDRAVDHISLYQLTIEPGTAFWQRHKAGGLRGLPEEDLAADLYEATLETCAARGLHAYEVSNLARPGSESRHNLIYWSGGEYLGIGPGAHGRVHRDGTRWATEARPQPGAWLADTERGSGDSWVALSLADQLAEYTMMGLRTVQGLNRERMRSFGLRPDGWERFEAMAVEGLLEIGPERVRATPRGRMVLNGLLREIMD